jgi:GNAT superfamily N-acetyltransferase
MTGARSRDPLAAVSPNRRGGNFEIVVLAPAHRATAARALSAALIDDPLWRALGPRSRLHRRAVLDLVHRAALLRALRWGGPSYVALRDGAPVGAAATFDAGGWPPPAWSTLLDLPALLLAGPRHVWRAMRVDGVLKRAHPRGRQVYLQLLGVRPEAQRGGVGSALLERVLERARERSLPVYLETMNPANPQFYAGHGFAIVGERTLARGVTAWLMRWPGDRRAA